MPTNLDEERDYSPEALKQREQARRMDDDGAAPLSPGEQAKLDQIEAGLRDDGGGGNKSEKGDEPKDKRPKSLEEDLSSRFQDALGEKGKDGDERGFYTGSGRKARKISGTRWLAQHRKLAAGLAAGGGTAILAGAAFFGFLNIFKLEFLLNNIDAKTFSRANAIFDRRSDRWVRAYISLRLMEYDGTVNPDQDHLFFRANGVDTDNPLRDWYRKLRTGNFEEKVFNRSGTQFVSMIDREGRPRPARITMKGKTGDIEFNFDPVQRFGNGDPDAAADFFERINAGDLNAFNQLGDQVNTFIDTEELLSDKEARRAIRDYVKDNTRWDQVFKRRHIRKDIQNKIGVRDWRFFETRRDNLDNRRIEFQRKMWQKLLPEDTRSGKFLLCIFGAGPCPRNADPNNPENRAAGSFDGSRTDSENGAQVDEEGRPRTDENGRIISGETGANGNLGDTTERVANEVGQGIAENASEDLVRTTLMKQILSKINIVTGALGAVQTMDMLSRIDNNITGGRLAALAVLAKGAQAMAAYTTYGIARDQARSGELTSEEYALLMETTKGAERSEAYDYYFNDGKSGTRGVSKEEYCSEDYEPQPDDYVWTCDKIKVGSTERADAFRRLYENSIGFVITPVMEAYRGLRRTPVIGQVIGIVGNIGGAIDNALSLIVSPVLDALQITRGLEYLTAWMTNAAMNFLGGGPILAGAFSPPGLIYTMTMQGGEVTAESTMRGSGAAISNPATQGYARELELAYEEQEAASQSFSQRYLSLDNSQSLAARSMFSLSTFSLDKFGSFFSSALGNLGSLFGLRASAQDTQENISGIDTYDFPAFCVERDPMANTPPADMTNADDLRNAAGQPFIDAAEISWPLLKDSDAFWARIYERVGDNDSDAETVLQIYNCETLDRRIRGSLGYVGGYTDDGGLEDGPSGTGSRGQPLTAPGLNGYTIPCQGQPRQVVRKTPSAPSADWTGIPISGTIATTSGGLPINVYIREACVPNPRTVLIVSSIHGTENGGQLISHELLFNQNLPDDVRIIAIPELNRWGVDNASRTNENGVNLNRNMDYRWDEMDDTDVTAGTGNYRGASPFSEPETAGLRDFILSLGPLSLSLHYHDNINYIGASHSASTIPIAEAYADLVNMPLGNSGGPVIYQKGSTDGWQAETTGDPVILVELTNDQSTGTILRHADALRTLLENRTIL